MANLAEQLGRRFEARAFLTVATLVHPDRDDLRHDLARLNRDSRTIKPAGRTLADMLVGEVRAPARIRLSSP